MNNDKSITRAWILALGFLVPAAAAHATCVSPGFNPVAAHFCNGCRYEGTMSMARDETCERVYRPNHNMGPIDFVGHRLVQRARHGIAGLNGTTFAYHPGKGYVGKDEFAIEVNYRDGERTGKFTVHWTVTVQ